LCLLLPLLGRTEDRGLPLVRAIQTKLEAIARESGPSIACILVSRNSGYHQAPWGALPDPENPGRLGSFDLTAATKSIPADAKNRQRLLNRLAELDLSDRDVVPESFGSGFVIDKTGLILTNAHVIRNATRIYVRLPGDRGSWADIHASDPRSDLAVLKLLTPLADLKPLTIHNEEGITAGSFVVSVANGYSPRGKAGENLTMSYGVVSRERVAARQKNNLQIEAERHKETLHHYGTLLQTDGRLPAWSGGPLFNLEGKVVGMTNALAGIGSSERGGLAIPCDVNIARIVEVLKRGEEVEYGFLGVVLANLNERGPIRLSRVSPGSPAAKAGLQPNETLVSINGYKIRNSDDLFLYVGMNLAGNAAKIVVSDHRGNQRSVDVPLAKFFVPGNPIASKRPPARFGLRVDYTSILAQRNPFHVFSRSTGDGVIIREVIPDSPADLAKLQPDKVITHVNGKAIYSPADYYREVAKAGKKVELTYLTSDSRPAELTLQEKETKKD
jgi:serine protease Do